jgi:hypothetical protein
LPLAPAGGELRFVFPFFNINSRELTINRIIVTPTATYANTFLRVAAFFGVGINDNRSIAIHWGIGGMQ